MSRLAASNRAAATPANIGNRHLVGARRLNHAGRGAAYSPLIWIGGRKMVLRGENQLLRVVKISRRNRNVCLRRRQIIVRCGVALHKPSFLKIFRLQLIEGMKRQKAPAREKKF